jgi:hypothetical protein
MSHEVCRVGDRVLKVLSRADVPEVSRKLRAARDGQGRVLSALEQPEWWESEGVRQAIMRHVRAR